MTRAMGRLFSTLRQIDPAAHMDGLPGDVTPTGRAQELHGCGDVFRLTLAADQRMAAARNGAARAGACRARAGDLSRHDAVHRDAPCTELDRERLGEPDEAGFRGDDMGAPGRAGVARDPAYIDDRAAALGEHARDDGTAREK